MNKDHTLEEVGQQFSVREHIRQIDAKALRTARSIPPARNSFAAFPTAIRLDLQGLIVSLMKPPLPLRMAIRTSA